MAPTRPVVALVACESYEPERIEEALERALGLIGEPGHLLDGAATVLLKASVLLGKPPEAAVTTHPAVVAALARRLADAGAAVSVGDSSGGAAYGRTGEALAASGLAAAAAAAGATLVNFDTAGVEEVTVEGARHLPRLRVARPVVEAERVVSVAKLKTHVETQLTGAVKNMLGTVPGGGKLAVHKAAPKPADLGHALVDVYLARPPDLAVIDAVIAMEGQGPSGGQPRAVGALIVSRSAPAADVVAAALVGLEPRVVPTVRAAAARGLGPRALAEVEVVGDALEGLRVPDFVHASTLMMELMPGWILKILNRWFFLVWPEVRTGDCVGCGDCAASCPAAAIEIRQGKARIDLKPCIRCFCCHELCPHRAVAIGKSLLVRLLSG